MSISVIVPAYNRADLIGQTLRSLLNQTLPANEIIVVDDGSTDGTPEAVEREFAVFSRQFSANRPSAIRHQSLPHLRLIRQENAGPGAARNRGLAEAKGEFIHFFDSDDIAAPNKHEEQALALREGADIAYGPWVKGYINKEGAGEKRYSFRPVGHVLQQGGLPKGDLLRELLTRWSIVPQACMFRRVTVMTSGAFPDDMFVAEDQLMFLRCLLSGARVTHTPATMTFYRLGAGEKLTASASASTRRCVDWLLFLQRAEEECQAKGITPDAWLGFDRRMWAAQKGGMDAQERSPCELRRFLYPALATADRWLGGLRARIVGDRQNPSFRCGAITKKQMDLFPR